MCIRVLYIFSKSISSICCCNFRLWNLVILLRADTKRSSGLCSSITLGALPHGCSFSILSIRCTVCICRILLLLHGNRKLSFSPSTLSISSSIMSSLLGTHSTRTSLSCRSLSLCILIRSKSSIDYLSSKICPIFFSFFNKRFTISLWFCIIFTLHSFHSLLSSSHIFLWNTLAGFLQDPIILVVIIMTPLIHKIFEYFAHVIIIWSLLEF